MTEHDAIREHDQTTESTTMPEHDSEREHDRQKPSGELTELICIECPKGCTLQARREGEVLRIRGAGCRRGREFAKAELTNPQRTLCTTMRTNCPAVPVLPVRVRGEIPKGSIFPVMAAINGATVRGCPRVGDVVLPDVIGLGADVIATSNLLWETSEHE